MYMGRVPPSAVVIGVGTIFLHTGQSVPVLG